MKKQHQTFTQQKYSSSHPLRRFLVWRFLENIFREIQKGKPALILDIGCGEGQASKFFLSRNPALKIVGVDIDSEAIKKARMNCPEMETRKASVYQLPFHKVTRSI